ncbi:MAG: TIGR04255 family protein [Pirellulales bacterium]|nr:TIGR04255 family protein [Pirellulales bacterium]
MSNSDQELPRFRKPPVVETVLGIYFRASGKFASAEQGILWDRYFRAQFPALEERPPTEEMRERFGEERLDPHSGVQWRVTNRPDAPRLWAAAENGQHVVQIQRNAFLANWQKAADDVAYRSYEERRQDFGNQLGQLAEFFRERDLGQIEPTSWIVTYINHIDYEGLEHVGPEVAKTLTVWSNQFSDSWLGTPDKLVLDFAFPLPNNAGRLHVNLTPVVIKKDKRQALRLDLTARGQLQGDDLANVLGAIDMGHEWVVRGFASLTHPEMHKVWERIH